MDIGNTVFPIKANQEVHKMKRFLSILLSLTICLTLLPAAVQVQAASVDDLSEMVGKSLAERILKELNNEK